MRAVVQPRTCLGDLISVSIWKFWAAEPCTVTKICSLTSAVRLLSSLTEEPMCFQRRSRVQCDPCAAPPLWLVDPGAASGLRALPWKGHQRILSCLRTLFLFSWRRLLPGSFVLFMKVCVCVCPTAAYRVLYLVVIVEMLVSFGGYQLLLFGLLTCLLATTVKSVHLLSVQQHFSSTWCHTCACCIYHVREKCSDKALFFHMLIKHLISRENKERKVFLTVTKRLKTCRSEMLDANLDRSPPAC